MPASPLVSADQLAAELASTAPPVVLDCRWQLAGGADRAAYDRGRLPGAAFVDLDRDLSAAPGPRGRHPLPDPAAFQAAMRRCGADDDRPVVAYDQGDAGGAARAWWLLGYFGHPDARVLDGGLPAWVAAGRPLDTGPTAPARPGGFTARPGRRPALDAAGAARVAAAGVLLDARVPARYAGREEPVDPVAGHIPGARNAPVGELLTGGRLRPAGELRRRFEALGVRVGVPVGAYCGSGVVASQLVLALEVAGVPAALYPGSWSEWVADPSAGIAIGSEPGNPRS